jgi:hypothetical protein
MSRFTTLNIYNIQRALKIFGSAKAEDGAAIATYLWTQLSGEPVTLADSAIATTTFIAPTTEGVLVFEFMAVDTKEQSGVDTVTITVKGTIQSEMPAVSDYNGDGKSDFLLRDSTGSWEIASMNGPNSSTIIALPSLASTGVTTEGQADFDGDGDTDILLRDSFGSWYMNIIEDNVVVETAALPIVPVASESIFYKGDIDGNSSADFILRDSSTGLLTVYYIQGITITRSQQITGLPASNALAGPGRREIAGDYDGDGQPEFIFRQNGGFFNPDWYYYDVDFSAGTSSSVYFYPLDNVVDEGWQLVGGADYDNDGFDELLTKSIAVKYDWKHVNIQASPTLTDSTVIADGTVSGLNSLPYPFGNKDFLEIAGGDNAFRMDMNGNGSIEIVLKNNKNQYYFYEMDGTTVINEGLVDLPQFPSSRTSQVK